METIFTFDLDKIYPEVLEALQNGQATLRDGVAYWTDLSKKNGIAQHMPLKELQVNLEKIGSLTELAQKAHVTQLVATGLSTGVVVGAIVVQTMYLADKIDKLQRVMDIVSTDINSQNMLFYMEKLSQYFGAVESARVLLIDKALVTETHDVACNLISQLSIERNEVLSLIDNLIGFADELTDRHLGHMLDFITIMLDAIPKAIYIESQLCDRYNKFRLAEHLMRENTRRYEKTLQYYRDWCNAKAKDAIRGDTEIALPFHEKKGELKALFSSKDNTCLLEDLKPITLKLVA